MLSAPNLGDKILKGRPDIRESIFNVLVTKISKAECTAVVEMFKAFAPVKATTSKHDSDRAEALYTKEFVLKEYNNICINSSLWCNLHARTHLIAIMELI